MLKQTSKNFKKFFLLEFTKELIRSTETYKELRIKKEVKGVIHRKPIKPVPSQEKLVKKHILRGAVKEKIKRDSEMMSQLKREETLAEFKKFYSLTKPVKPSSLRAPFSYTIPAPLKIPESRLPETVQYLRPIPTSRMIDLGKLHPLIRDSLVKVIECNGPDEKIIVMGAMGRKSTKIILTKEEIDDTINKFSEAAKIPVHEGVFKVVFGRLIFSAMISEVVSSKFLIRKMFGPDLVK
jgi:hypothetical protein